MEGVTRASPLKPFGNGGDKFYTKTYKRSFYLYLSPPIINPLIYSNRIISIKGLVYAIISKS